MGLTVSMPNWRSPTLRRAVTAVLGQTYRDLTLVVVNDGDDPDRAWEPIADIDDPRLIRFDLPPTPSRRLTSTRGHGRYTADTVVAYAADTEWFTCHDADDTSHPTRYQSMLRLAARGADVVPGGEQIYPAGPGRMRYRRPTTRLPARPQGGRIPHMWHISAVYRTDIFRAAICPVFRVGYDSLMSSMLLAAEDVKVIPDNHVHYSRIGRVDSLTRHPETAIGSQFRNGTVDVLARMWHDYQSQPPSLDNIRRVVAAATTPAVWEQIEEWADQLRPLITAKNLRT